MYVYTKSWREKSRRIRQRGVQYITWEKWGLGPRGRGPALPLLYR